MKNRKEDIFNHLGIAILMVLFFFLIPAFSGKSAKQTNDAFRYEYASEIHSNFLKAISVDAAQLPSFKKNWVFCIDKMNFMHFNENLKISVENRKITQRIVLLQKTELLIKPIVFCGFYYHLFSLKMKELPILS